MLDTSGASTGVDVFRPVPSIESYQINAHLNAHRYGISAHGVGKCDYRISLGYQRDPGFPSLCHQYENSRRIDDAFETSPPGVRGTYTPSVRDALDISAGHTDDRPGFGTPDPPILTRPY